MKNNLNIENNSSQTTSNATLLKNKIKKHKNRKNNWGGPYCKLTLLDSADEENC